eukprot:CAMPEP_0194187620 /NCGR_PEP_ID=MMETSP0154-20130528/51652_1 /TAXON_ID=1049557 /ORGANISM="Thalassiothrix antarctica, Strain L6-D1" /LENGTH=33 /DNA_ID= /DNA_START= /DNA_END= /DNA_ORIENTATION=
MQMGILMAKRMESSKESKLLVLVSHSENLERLL